MRKIHSIGISLFFLLGSVVFLPSWLDAFEVTYLNPEYVASSAYFPVPAIDFEAHAIAFDDEGNLYTVDTAQFGSGTLDILKIEAATSYSTSSTLTTYSGHGITGLVFGGQSALFLAEINSDKDSGLIAKIDTTTLTVTDTLALPNFRPSGIGVDAGGNVYFPGRLGSLPSFGNIYETDLSTAPITFWPDFAGTGLAVDAWGHIFASTRKGDVSPVVSNSIYMLDPDTQTAERIATFGSGIEELAFDSEGKLYALDQAGAGEVSAIIQIGLVPFCEGDFDDDCDVDGSDLAVFAADFGRTDCSGDCEGDFDEDNDVDGSDLAVFAADFGRTDCPK